MKLPFLGKKKKGSIDDDEVLLALDVGTKFIKAAIFKVIDNQVHIIGYARTPQQSNSMHSAMIINLQNVIAATDISIGQALALAEEIEGKEVNLPSKVILGIAGELVKGVTVAADYDREKPNKKIDQNELFEVVQMVKEQMFPQIHSDIAEELGLNQNQIEEIDTKVVSANIDGVKVDNPIGFTGAKSQVSIYTTFSPSLHLNSLKELAARLGLELIDLVVEPYAISRSIKESRKETFSGIIIDIGGGTTDVALVEKGTVMGTKMYAFGGQVFTKRLMNDFKISMEDAEKLKLDYSNQTLSEKKMKEVKQALAKDIPIWAEGVEISLSEFEDIKEYPDHMYFCGGGAHLPDIKTGMLAHPWLQVLPFKRFPRMSYIYPNQLEGLVDHTKKMIDPMDVAPASLAIMALENYMADL